MLQKSALSEKRRRKEWFYVSFRLSSGKEIELGIPADRFVDFKTNPPEEEPSGKEE